MSNTNQAWNTIEEVVDLAENSTSPPPFPEGGLPRQKIPGWIRWPIRVLILPFVILDLAAQRIVQFFIKTPYKQTGGCTQRGNCCYYILFPAPTSSISKIFYVWNIEINGFYARDPKPLHVEGDQFIVMGCRYLQQDGRCSHYRLRPSICRTWPQIEYFGHPRILKGCGYQATPRDPNFDPFSFGEQPKKSSKLNIIKE